MNIQDICIQGDPQRGKDIIKFFEVMGVKNRINVGAERDCYYYYASETGDQGSWIGAIEQTKKTLIRLQPNSLLPEDWCVKGENKVSMPVVEYLNEKYDAGLMGSHPDWFYGEGVLTKCSHNPFGLELTESQFLALSGYKPEQKEQPEEPFQWTDELVKEYITACRAHGTSMGNFKASKSRKALFTTEDGVPVYEGDEVYFVNENWNSGKETASALCNSHGVDPAKHFSTQTQAEKYIFNHKPVLSYYEVQDWLGLGKPDSDKLKQLVESKLKP